MHASTPTRAVGMALAATILILTSGSADTKLPVPTEEQKAQVDLTKAKAAWGDRVAALQTCKTQDKAATPYQAGGKAAYTQPDAPCVDPRLLVAPVPAASTPIPAAKG